MVEITDEKSFYEWAKSKPPEAARVIAHRSAARVLTDLVSGYEYAFYENPLLEPHIVNNLVKVTFRATLACRLRCIAPNDKRRINTIRAAYTSANDYAYTHADDAVYESTPAILAAKASASAATDAATVSFFDPGASDIWAELTWDVQQWEKNQDARALLFSPLWHGDRPNWAGDRWQKLAGDRWQKLQKYLRDDDSNWEFWIDFYEGVLEGKKYSDDYVALLDEIAQIDESIWKKDAKDVNAVIAEKYQAYIGGKYQTDKDTQKPQEPKPSAPSPSESQKQQLDARIRLLLLRPAETAEQATQLANYIKEAVKQTKREINDHEGLEIYDMFAAQLKKFGGLLQEEDVKIAELEAENQALRERIAELEHTIKNSDNPNIKKCLLDATDRFLNNSAAIAPSALLYLLTGSAPLVLGLAAIKVLYDKKKG